jgi:hypothetical protein
MLGAHRYSRPARNQLDRNLLQNTARSR